MSTSAAEKLDEIESPHFHLRRVASDEQEPAATRLSYPNRWYLESRYGGCSCYFRNLLRENPPEFWEPADWFEEDPDDIEATRAFYDLISRLIRSGEKVDIAAASTGDEVEHDMTVSLSDVSREAFRFMDGIRFDIEH